MNGIQFAIVVGIIFAAVFLIPRAIRNDNIAALENLEDEQLAGDAADAWNRGQW